MSVVRGREIIIGDSEMTQSEIEKAAEEYAVHDSQYWGPDMEYEGHRQIAIDAFLAGAEHAKPRWVKYEDEKPRNGEIVLIPYRTYSMPAEYNLDSQGNPFWLLWDCPGSINAERTLHFVTQWMRLPPAPEGESK